MIVLDTHTLVFWIQAEDYLSSTAVNAIETASTIGVSSVSFWEVSLLVRKGRLSLADNVTVRSWAQRVLQIPRVEDIPINAAIAVIADSLDMHSDPADRFIAASALSVHAPLVTQDRLLGGYDWLDTIW